jgi:hypothetical protein
MGPAVIGSFLAVFVLSSIPSMGQGLERLFARRRRGLLDDSPRHMSLDLLRQAILGNGKHEIVSALGPPPTTTAGTNETWYYPLRSHERLAMAISFNQGRAQTVEFFHAPR